jgi:superfamily II DNA or RNA helicase
MINSLLIKELNQTATIVTYFHDNSTQKISAFKSSTEQWIVSVGMISEGTDIPRLQVCCHLSSIKTELYFRQVLGRILRSGKGKIEFAWLFTFAETSLVEFAERINIDIPDSCSYVDMESSGAFSKKGLNKLPSDNNEGKMKRISNKDTSHHTRNSLNVIVGSINLNESFSWSTTTNTLRIKSLRSRVIEAFL